MTAPVKSSTSSIDKEADEEIMPRHLRHCGVALCDAHPDEIVVIVEAENKQVEHEASVAFLQITMNNFPPIY